MLHSLDSKTLWFHSCSRDEPTSVAHATCGCKVELNLNAYFFLPCLTWFDPQSLRKQRRIWPPWKSKRLDWHGNMTGCWRSTLKHRWVEKEGFIIWRLLPKRFLSGGLAVFFFRIFNHFTTVCLNSNKICLMKILKKLLNQWIFIQNKGKLSVQFAMIML